MLCYYNARERDEKITIFIHYNLFYIYEEVSEFITNFYCGIYLNLKNKKLLKEGFSELFSVFKRFFLYYLKVL
jgi:hypothetical protein